MRRGRLIGVALLVILALLIALPVILWASRNTLLNHSLVREWLLDQAEAELGLRPEWQGKLTLAWSEQLHITLGAGSLPNPPGFSIGPLLSWRDLRWSMDGDAAREFLETGDLYLRRVEIDTARLQLETNASGTGNWELLFPNVATSPSTQLKIDTIEISESSLGYQEFSQDNFALDIKSAVLNSVHSDQSGQWKITHCQLIGTDDLWLQINNLSLADTSALTDAEDQGLSADWEIRNLSLRNWPLPAAIHSIGAPLVISQAAGRLDSLQSSEAATLQAIGGIQIDSLRLDDISLQGSLRLEPDSTRVELNLGRVRLDPFLSAESAAAPAADTPLIEQIPLDTLRHYGVSGIVNIEEVLWGQDRLQQVTVRMTP